MNNSELSRSIPVRFSNLKYFARSPAHYLHAIQQERTDSGPMRIGRGVHCMVLGGQYDHYEGEGDRRGKGFAEFERNATSDTVLSKAEYWTCKGIADAVKSDPTAREILRGANTQNEVKIEATSSGRDICGTVDAFNLDTLVLADLKTTRDADPKRFSRLAQSYQYVNQLAWYRMLIRMKYGVEMRTMRLVAVETSAPYNVSVINVPLDMILEADIVNATWFARLLECEASGNFPGYTGGAVVEMSRSNYNTNETDESEAT